MVPLDRSGVTAPANWDARVRRRLADHKAFARKARAFEKLVLNGKKRRTGFVTYAGHVFKTGKFPAVWRCKRLRRLLLGMTGGNCAYCQGGVDATSHAAVEHFRPKSLFPTLAYDVGNYLYSCQLCNETKLDKWPVRGGYVRPDVGDPTGRFRFKPSGWVKVKRGDADALATVRDFGLNRPSLRESRGDTVRGELEKLAPILRLLDSPGTGDADRLLALKGFIAKPRAPYSEAINQNVRRAVKRVFPTLHLG